MELCSVCSRLELWHWACETQTLGSYDELLLKSHSLGAGRGGCGGCAFFAEVLQTSDRWRERVSELSGLSIMFDKSIGLGTRAPASRTLYALGDLNLEICSEESETSRNPYGLHPRPVPRDPRDSVCFDTIALWIHDCRKHRGCSIQTKVALPKRVIEIPINASISPRLRITNGELGQYVILSHCWGTKGLKKLTNSLLTRYQDAIELEPLPRNFRDAIEITWRLGFRYLWIDALCIIQDNAEDWAQEAGMMASYYGLSALMISATEAEDSSQGILTIRNAPYSPVLGKDKRYYLRQQVLSEESDIASSVLATRGWTAQERMLAPRILHYTKRQIIWECAEGLSFESTERDPKWKSNTPEIAYKKSNLQPFVTKALSQRKTAPRNYPKHFGLTETSLLRLRVWNQCIGEYSRRSLTVPTDKLHAIAGVARMLNDSGELGTYLAGLWSAPLSATLNWIRATDFLSSPPVYTAPSWSWASMKGGVSHHFREANPNAPRLPVYLDNFKNWATKFHLKLVEQLMLLQDQRNIYGAVLEGSYIVVEGACITHAQFRRLLWEAFRSNLNDPAIFLDKNVDCGSRPGQISDREEKSPDRDCGNKNEVIRMQHSSIESTPYDFCMFLKGDSWMDCSRYINLLMLRWVDREAQVAQRVGIARLPVWRQEDLAQFYYRFEAANWQRWTVKLV